MDSGLWTLVLDVSQPHAPTRGAGGYVYIQVARVPRLMHKQVSALMFSELCMPFLRIKSRSNSWDNKILKVHFGIILVLCRTFDYQGYTDFQIFLTPRHLGKNGDLWFLVVGDLYFATADCEEWTTRLRKDCFG